MIPQNTLAKNDILYSKPKKDILLKFQTVRGKSQEFCEPLEIEDFVIQTREEVSPPKWHLAHTTWFFENFILRKYLTNYRPFHPAFHELFNSYYQTVGKPFSRPRRGYLSRPTVKEVYAYRQAVNESVSDLLAQDLSPDVRKTIESLVELGIQHEQQHQELLFMDIKYNFGFNPLRPAYLPSNAVNDRKESLPPFKWIEFDEGQIEIGTSDFDSFSFDNERPRHKKLRSGFCMANRTVTNGEYLEFMAAKGYERPEFWLADGWTFIGKNQLHHPLYWEKIDGQWMEFTLRGMRKLDENAPVTHTSFYEADAFARWKEARLPTEFEWESIAQENGAISDHANFLDSQNLHPTSASVETGGKLYQLVGDTWEWTSSPYCPYPGFQPLQGSLGEYNGKFMANQMVLRGGACVTPKNHYRHTYRNFFYHHDQWAFTGIRLAKDSK